MIPKYIPNYTWRNQDVYTKKLLYHSLEQDCFWGEAQQLLVQLGVEADVCLNRQKAMDMHWSLARKSQLIQLLTEVLKYEILDFKAEGN